MEINKTFVTLDNIATITCPKCHKAKPLSVGKYRDRKHVLKVRCSCGHSFSSQLDFRRHYRKETNLEGTYHMMSPAIGKGRLNVLNISRSGVGCAIGFSVLSNHSIQVGQKAQIAFDLDNKKRSVINKVVVIRSITDQYIGCEFENSHHLDKELGFYLQP